MGGGLRILFTLGAAALNRFCGESRREKTTTGADRQLSEIWTILEGGLKMDAAIFKIMQFFGFLQF